MEKTMKKDKPPQKPLGRQPAGAILVDGKWQLTELSTQLSVERLLRCREARRTKWRAKQALLRRSHPELFAKRGLDQRQTTLTPARSTERKVDLPPCKKTDTSSTADTYDAFWRSVQRDDGIPNLSSGSASL